MNYEVPKLSGRMLGGNDDVIHSLTSACNCTSTRPPWHNSTPRQAGHLSTPASHSRPSAIPSPVLAHMPCARHFRVGPVFTPPPLAAPRSPNPPPPSTPSMPPATPSTEGLNSASSSLGTRAVDMSCLLHSNSSGLPCKSGLRSTAASSKHASSKREESVESSTQITALDSE